jgi:hypothetical protein
MMVGLFILAHRLAPSPGWRIFLEVGVVVVGYGLIALWLETHPGVLQDRSPAEADSAAVKSPQVEILAPLSPHLRRQLYITIIYDEPAHPTGSLPLNGHEAKTIPSLSEEAAE